MQKNTSEHPQKLYTINRTVKEHDAELFIRHALKSYIYIYLAKQLPAPDIFAIKRLFAVRIRYLLITE